jgi:hypothetical protein
MAKAGPQNEELKRIEKEAADLLKVGIKAPGP